MHLPHLISNHFTSVQKWPHSAQLRPGCDGCGGLGTNALPPPELVPDWRLTATAATERGCWTPGPSRHALTAEEGASLTPGPSDGSPSRSSLVNQSLVI